MKVFAQVSKKYYDQTARRVNYQNAQVYFSKRVTLLEANLDVKQKKIKFLDAGCGEGTFLAMVRKKHPGLALYGFDLSARQIKLAKQKLKKVPLQVADAGQMPYQDNFFDVIFINALLHHVESIPVVIKEIVRVCRPGGKIILIEPNRLNPLVFASSLLKEHEHGGLRMSHRYLKRLLQKYNFRSIKFFRLNSILFPFQSFPGPGAFKFFYHLENWPYFPSFLKSHFAFVIQLATK